MFLVGFESTNLVVLLKQEKKTTGLNQSYSGLCFISFVYFDSPSYSHVPFFLRFLLFCYYPLNIVLLAIWRCTRKWEKGGIHHVNFQCELWCWWRCSGAFAFFDVANNIFDMPVVCIHTNSMSPLQISQFDSASFDSMLCYCRTWSGRILPTHKLLTRFVFLIFTMLSLAPALVASSY
jgi:hypothetical protein